MTEKKTVSQIIANRITDQLSKGVVPWHKPWAVIGQAYNYTSKRRYNILNQMFLEYQGGYITFKKAKELGWKPKDSLKDKGEFCFQFFGKEYERKNEDGSPMVDDKTGEVLTAIHYTLKYYPIFAINLFVDKDGNPIEEKAKGTHYTELEANQNAENVIKNYLSKDGAKIEFVRDSISNSAYYMPAFDKVVIPSMKQFEDVSTYYSTAFHELTHSTGAPARLNRLKTTDDSTFGSKNYSKEELVAELGACILSSITGVSTDKSFDNSAAYIDNWNKHIKDNPDDVVSACTLAEQAVKMIAKDMIDENMELLESPIVEAPAPEEVPESKAYTDFKLTDNYYRVIERKNDKLVDANFINVSVDYSRDAKAYYLNIMPQQIDIEDSEFDSYKVMKTDFSTMIEYRPELLLRVKRASKKGEAQAFVEAKEMVKQLLEDDDNYIIDTTAPVLL